MYSASFFGRFFGGMWAIGIIGIVGPIGTLCMVGRIGSLGIVGIVFFLEGLCLAAANIAKKRKNTVSSAFYMERQGGVLPRIEKLLFEKNFLLGIYLSPGINYPSSGNVLFRYGNCYGADDAALVCYGERCGACLNAFHCYYGVFNRCCGDAAVLYCCGIGGCA